MLLLFNGIVSIVNCTLDVTATKLTEFANSDF